MKTLIIHPDDRTTDFLKVIYQNIENKKVLTGGIPLDKVNELIKEYDRVIMCGHGSGDGLFSIGAFSERFSFVIDHSTATLLSEKDNSIFIWCNADQYVKQHNIKGFYTGMFISEVPEATYCGLPGMTDDIINESNNEFCTKLSQCINESKETMYQTILKEYEQIAQHNPVAKYNFDRLYLA